MTAEPLPLATIFREVLAFLATRPDAVVFGAHAVNAYCQPERMTADIDLLSTDAAVLAEALRRLLADRFHAAIRVREIGGGFRIYQIREPRNRHLVDIRPAARLPAHRVFEGVRVVEPAELAAMKAVSMVARQDREKGLSDRLDLHRLLRAFPELREESGEVAEKLRQRGAGEAVMTAWIDLVRHPLASDDDRDEGTQE